MSHQAHNRTSDHVIVIEPSSDWVPGSGFKWHLPDLETSELAYRIADYAYREARRGIVDATVGGQPRIFSRIEFESLEF